MRIMMIGAAIAAVAAAMPANAQVYIGARGAANMDRTSENRGEITSNIPATADFGAIPAGTSLSWETAFETGYDVSGQIGYRFADGLRVEAELGYSDSKVDDHDNVLVGGAGIDSVDVAVLTRGPASPNNPLVGEVLATDPGSVKSYYAFGNVFYDINASGAFQPYFGFGLGAQRVEVDYRPSGVGVVDDRQTRFAYQLMGGATVKLNNNLELFAQYTWRATPDRVETDVDLLPARLGIESRQSLIGGGVRIAFGGGGN